MLVSVQINEETYECIVGDQFEGSGEEIQVSLYVCYLMESVGALDLVFVC